MSNILSEWTKETVVETRMTKELEGIKCDKCGNVIKTTEKDPEIYYRVRLSEYIPCTSTRRDTDYSDICPICLTLHIDDFFKNRTEAASAYIEKKYAFKTDIHSDKNGNFKI